MARGAFVGLLVENEDLVVPPRSRGELLLLICLFEEGKWGVMLFCAGRDDCGLVPLVACVDFCAAM